MSEAARPPAFFDQYPRFYETGNTGAGPRLNARHTYLIEPHVEYLRGRTVLDIGSHDGRWSFAALAAGAKYITGIEPRTALVEASRRNYQAYGIAPERFTFHAADALEFLKRRDLKVDTVLLFGIFYHVHDHVALLRELWHTGARTILVDTAVSPDPSGRGRYENTVSMLAEKVVDISNAADEIYPGAGFAIVGYPSVRAVTFLLEQFGFQVAQLSWAPYLKRWGGGGLEDYAAGERATFLARRA